MAVSDNTRGLILAMLSSLFIGSSFILKKKGLKRAAAVGTRAGVGGYTYLLEPLWWSGMLTMIVGEIANFVAYVYAPAVLVTPLGALSIIVSALLAHFMLKERLQWMGILGCVTCIVGSVVIVIHAPQEHTPVSVQEIWNLATQPAFLIYVAATLSIVLVLIFHFGPHHGQTNILIYLGICSLMGSLTVMSIKAIGIAMKLTLEGISQIAYLQTWLFVIVAAICVITQLNYLNKALDTFSAAIVSPIYYVMFTTLTIIASVIMFKDWSGQDASSIASEICGFITVLSGTIILHATREQEPDTAPESKKGKIMEVWPAWARRKTLTPTRLTTYLPPPSCSASPPFGHCLPAAPNHLPATGFRRRQTTFRPPSSRVDETLLLLHPLSRSSPPFLAVSATVPRMYRSRSFPDAISLLSRCCACCPVVAPSCDPSFQPSPYIARCSSCRC